MEGLGKPNRIGWPGGSNLTKAVTALLGLGCAVLLSACGVLEAGPINPPNPTNEAGRVVLKKYIAVVDNERARLLGGRRFGDASTGFLVGPHFVLRQRSSGVVHEIDAEVARRLGLYAGIRAPDGYEFVVADFDKHADYQHAVPEDGRQPGSLDGGNKRKWLKIGKTPRRPLKADLTGGSLLIVCAPEDARVRLQVTDGRRTQSLNLRTGQRVKDKLSGYYPARKWSAAEPENGWQTAGLTDATAVAFSFSDVRAELSPFAPNGHWSRRGRAWLYVTFRTATACADVRSCRVRLSPEQDMRLRVPRHATRTPVGSGFTAKSAHKTPRGAVTSTVAFEVPASIDSAKFVVSPKGRVAARKAHAKKASRTHWEHAPSSVAIKLSKHG